MSIADIWLRSLLVWDEGSGSMSVEDIVAPNRSPWAGMSQ